MSSFWNTLERFSTSSLSSSFPFIKTIFGKHHSNRRNKHKFRRFFSAFPFTIPSSLALVSCLLFLNKQLTNGSSTIIIYFKILCFIQTLFVYFTIVLFLNMDKYLDYLFWWCLHTETRSGLKRALCTLAFALTHTGTLSQALASDQPTRKWQIAFRFRRNPNKIVFLQNILIW